MQHNCQKQVLVTVCYSLFSGGSYKQSDQLTLCCEVNEGGGRPKAKAAVGITAVVQITACAAHVLFKSSKLAVCLLNKHI
jgi:hypothetical protein